MSQSELPKGHQGYDISIITDITITKEETLTRIIHRTCFVTSVALLLLFSIAAGASAQKKDKKTKRVDEAIVQSKRAAETFDRVMKSVCAGHRQSGHQWII